MNSPSSPPLSQSSLFANVDLAPRDPILGITEAFHADPNPNKVNLGVGVYTDDEGKVPVLECVRRAEQQMAASAMPRNYLPIDGLRDYERAAQELVFGAESALLHHGRLVTVQTLGGTGGLKVGADLLRRVNPSAEAWISDPSWENHRAIFEYAGFRVNAYPYYDAATHGVRFDAMMECFEQMPAGSVVVWHSNLWHGAFARRAEGQRVMFATLYNRPFMAHEELFSMTTTREMIERNGGRFGVLTGVLSAFPFDQRGPNLEFMVARQHEIGRWT